ncbi:MAG: V/A-type H+/Na+-transporting ATPase subunit [Thermoanaerobacteraceae bacterium]|jgi:V/A-type H+-transporting ATPase subunit F|nr:V/A-type H+/Na+-transporting ATPase subunit [Thermoanaerobacteraceae bacterium]MDN5302735.1 V/A-type H+/Na+-transporting ATPase subunit [Thermoanaerobacteraceae bacterium]MDN5312585.1 V/A-type H+/Na+-transporting ATPase subunit [Thermoanaerobacteraceae bacterium]
MNVFLISDNTHTLTGMRLAGVEGVVVHTREEVLNELKKVKESRDIGILLITELLAEKVQQELDEMKLSSSLPIIIEIPDRHGSRRPPDFLTRYIRESIGLKI